MSKRGSDREGGQTVIDAESEAFTARLSQTCRKYSDPLFLQDYFLASGHGHKTHNGTATFVKYEGKHYLCTCEHVATAIGDQSIVGSNTLHPTASLMIGKLVVNLSSFTTEGLQSSFDAPAARDGYKFDVCIALIESHWDYIRTHKEKEAIDLDSWSEPPWSEVELCAAAGYADEHKTTQDDKVTVPMPVVTAELQSKIQPDTREFTLSSSLSEPHGMYFSGMSGGPILALWGNDNLAPIGLIFEGYPSNRATPTSNLAGPNDILIRGLLLTPTTFSHWLQQI